VLGKPRKIRSVLRRTGVPASRAILIGDETRDIDAARACGVASGAVGWGYADAQTLRSREPTEVFERLEEIVNRIA
jgi:phosphoglycolate phosphatase